MEEVEQEKRHGMKVLLSVSALICVLIVVFMTTKLQEKESDKVKPIKYTLEKEVFMDQVSRMAEKFTVRELDGQPVVHPEPGSNVYIPSGNNGWGPVIELEKNKTYRLHVASIDSMTHAIWVEGLKISQKLRKGNVYMIEVTPKFNGEFTIVCREFCGPQHYNMLGKIIVVD